jgi:iron complex outermembrane recepter protein
VKAWQRWIAGGGIEKKIHLKGWTTRCAFALCVVLCLIGEANAGPKVYRIDLPALTVDEALNELSEQVGVPVLFPYDLAQSRVAHPVVGKYTLPQALDILLQGTGLSGGLSDKGVLTISLGRSEVPHSNDTGETAVTSKQSDQNRSSPWKSWVAALSALLAPIGASVVHGQEAAETTKLDEIIVTAQRREETLDKVPVSVTAFSQKTMDELHVQSFTDLAGVVPGLVVSTPGPGVAQSNTDVAIRGIFSNGNAPTTGIYIDETPISVRQNLAAGFSGSPQPDIFDLDRIEVLRGPQGTLFGSGAMGGVIRYITPQPNLQNSSGYAKAEFGYTDRGSPSYAVGVAYGAPIVQDVAGFRLSGWFHSDGGFIDTEDAYTGQILKRNANSSNAYTFRPAFTIVPAEGLSITPAVFIQHQHSDEPNEYWRTEVLNPEAGAHVSGYGATVQQPLTDDLTVPSLAIKYDFHGLSLQSDTSYLHRSYTDFDDWSNFLGAFFGAPPITPSLSSFSAYDKNIDKTTAWQQEFRLASQDPDSRLNWVAGAYYRRAVEQVAQYIAPDLTPITELVYGLTSLQVFGAPNYVAYGQAYNSFSQASTVTEQKAVFGEISFKITSQLKANIGVRVERSAIRQQQLAIAGPLQGTAYSSILLPDQSQTPVTPRFGLTYQYTDQDMIYATAAKGYRTGGSNAPTTNPLCGSSLAALGLTSVPGTFNSDSLWSYEIGAKDSFFERRLTFQASAFYIDWTGIQTSVNLPSCGVFFTANRGKAVSQGFDFQAAAVLAEGLKVSANVGYDNAYQPNAEYGAPRNGVAPVLVGAGDKLPGVAPWSASLHADYSRDIGRLWDGALAYVRVDYRWLDADPRADPNVAAYDPGLGVYPNQAYGVLNLRIGTLHNGLDISAFVNNVTNSDPRLGLTHASIGDPLYSATAIRPLTAGVTALYRF